MDVLYCTQEGMNVRSYNYKVIYGKLFSYLQFSIMKNM